MKGHVLEVSLEEGAAGCGLQAMSYSSIDDLAVGEAVERGVQEAFAA